jgi:poly-gamma-glutamate capsule biosynthesis protein CapA/YwtB (metallophosphatase superfamily)
MLSDLTPPVTLALGGDVMLGRLVKEAIRARGPAHPWGDLVPLLWSADAFLINLECAITTRTEEWPDGHEKPFHFRADPAAVEALRIARVDVATLANNHIGDFGPDGLLDTVAALDRAGIAHAGAGPTLRDAWTPATIAVRGLRIAVLAVADYPEAWAATASAPGLAFVRIASDESDFAPLRTAIAAARAASDLVVLSIHWGPNMRERPTAEFQRFAHRVIEAGATILWGHSAHVVQGIEHYRGGVILYDTGDLVDDYAVDPLRNDLGALVLLRVRPRTVEHVELVPTRIDQMQVHRSTGDDRRWFLRRLETLCRELGTAVVVDPDGSVHAIPAPSAARRNSEVP